MHNTQIRDMFLFCVFCVRIHSPLCSCAHSGGRPSAARQSVPGHGRSAVRVMRCHSAVWGMCHSAVRVMRHSAVRVIFFVGKFQGNRLVAALTVQWRDLAGSTWNLANTRYRHRVSRSRYTPILDLGSSTPDIECHKTTPDIGYKIELRYRVSWT